MLRWKLIAAALWVFASNLALVWWVKGDLEMGWIIGLPAIVAGGLVFGGLSAFLLRSWRASLAMAGASVAWSAVLAYAALNTPNSWKQRPAGLAAARRFASDRGAILKAVETTTGYAVEPQTPARVEATDSLVTKQGFSFALVRRPGRVRISVSFDVGPQSAAEFDEELRPVYVPSDTLTVRAAALERRFPQARLIEAGGNGPYLPRDLVPVRIARAETDWDIVVFRIADGGEPLREVARYPREELMRRFADAVNAAGIGPLESAVIYFRPVKAQDVFFEARPEFRFIGLLANARYWRAELLARLSGGEMEFVVANRLTRPGPGALSGVGDRR